MNASMSSAKFAGHIRRLVSIAIAAMIHREYAERVRQRLH
jgi:hypothetical protein